MLSVARKMRRAAGMSVGFMIAACVFTLVLGCAVACVDWWREARMLTPRFEAMTTIKSDVKPVQPTAQRRAA